MHGLCLGCHQEQAGEEVASGQPYLTDCATCHRQEFASEDELRKLDQAVVGAMAVRR